MGNAFHGEDQMDHSGLGLNDLPLGPWAGASVTTWASKTGSVWHGDPDRSQLRSRSRQEVHVQPVEGTMADRVLPTSFRCCPPGALRDHQEAVESLLHFDATTRKVAALFEAQHLDLSVFNKARRGSEELTTAADGPLAGFWRRCQKERESLVSRLECHPTSRIPVMLAAEWVLSGKTPRRHQERYTAFLDFTERECGARRITSWLGARGYVNQHFLLNWLAAVATGQEPSHVTAHLTDKEVERSRAFARDAPEDFYDQLREAWRFIGEAWARMLDGIALAHQGEIVAIFHEHEVGLNWEMRELFNTVFPCTHLRTTEFSWTCGRIPAILRLFLNERKRGLVGLVLTEEHAHLFDTEKCALFLRNLVIDLDCPETADHVQGGNASHTAEELEGDYPKPRLHWRLQGFGAGVHDFGLTGVHVLLALRAAYKGTEFPRGRSPRKRPWA